jgi:outer membrane biosynthesis protein TonB
MIYVYAGILIVILVLVFLIVRWWNLPKVIEERREAADAAQKRRFERRDRFLERWGWRRRKPVDPTDSKKPEPKPEVQPEPKEEPATPEKPKDSLPELNPTEPRERRRWLPWRRRKN